MFYIEGGGRKFYLVRTGQTDRQTDRQTHTQTHRSTYRGGAHLKRKICKIVAYGCQTPSAQRRSDQNNGHLRLCQQPRAAHALRSDQLCVVCSLSIYNSLVQMQHNE